MIDITVGDLLVRAAKLYPKKMATAYQGNCENFSDFYNDTLKYKDYLENHGCTKGDRVAVISRNRPEILKLLFASALAGYVFVPINFRLTEGEVSFLIDDCEPSILFTDETFKNTCNKAANASKKFNTQNIADIQFPLETLKDNLPSNYSIDVKPEDLFGIFYTSGTTGSPKGVMLSHRNMLSGVINHTIAYQLSPSDICLHIMPLYHTMESSLALCQFFVGGGNVIEDHFDKNKFWETIDFYGVTHTTGVFTMLQGMLEASKKIDGSAGKTLKTISLGGQSVPRDIMEKAISILGEGRIIQVYGLTEASPLVTYLPREDMLDTSSENKLIGSVGKELYLCKVKIINAEGNEIGPNQPGEVLVNGSNVMMGYWKRDDDTKNALSNGWLHTGDIGKIDEDGYLFLVDRMKDLIISGGENITPGEVEEVIFGHPNVIECSVFGVSDDTWGESVVGAVCVNDSSITEKDIQSYCLAHLAKYKVPKHIIFMDSLPKDPVGKIQKRILKQSILDYTGE